MIRPTRPQTTAVALFLAEIAAATAIWRLAPHGSIPVHFDLFGQPDRYGDRALLALLVAGSSVLGTGCWALLEAMRRRAARPTGLVWAQGVVLLTFALIAAVLAALAFAPPGALRTWTPLATGSLLMLCIGAALGKVGPNPVVGVRTFWSLSSRLAWEKSNRLGGRLLFWIGVVGLAATPIAPEPYGVVALVTAAVLAAGAAVFESWRVWRTDPNRAVF